MPTYSIIEHTLYSVDAEDEDEAVEILVQSEDTDEYFVEVTRRIIIEEPED